jgi:hypothetical protein
MDRREWLLAKSWERARQKVLRTEAFLEDALAAALEVPEFWQRLANECGCTGHVPPGQPQISTQDSVDEGRTDIVLEWTTGYRLALELKTTEPPSTRQIERYLRSNVDVLAVAKLPASVNPELPAGRRFFGVKTWARIHEIDWEDAPLEVRQLHRLLEVTEVVVPKVSRAALEGLVTSWDIWDSLEAWSRKGLEAAQGALARGGFKCVQQDKARQHVKVDMTYQRLVWWMWPSPWQDDSLAIYAGLYVGRDDDPLLAAPMPDLVLALHLDPASRRGMRLRDDATWTEAAKRWSSRALDQSSRDFDPGPESWEILRCRASAQELVDADDPGAHMVHWMEARAQEWVDDGIVRRLSELLASTPERQIV